LAVADGVRRVEEQHVDAGALLAREERQGDGRRFPDGAVRVPGPVERFRRDGGARVVRRGDGGDGRYVARAEEPFVRLGRLVRPAFGPEPSGRLR